MDKSDIIAVVGLLSIVLGVSMWSVPAAFVVNGLLVLLAYTVREIANALATGDPGRDEPDADGAESGGE